MVTLFVKKNSVKGPTADKCRDPTFGLHFVISSARRKKVPQLEWKKYTVNIISLRTNNTQRYRMTLFFLHCC